MFGKYITSMPRLNDVEERKKKSLKPGPTQVNHKYTRASTSSGKASSSTRCQKCENFGHFTYNCPVTHAPYKARPSRTQQLTNPKSLRDVPSVEVPEEFLTKKGIAEKILASNEKQRQEAQSKLAVSKSSTKKVKTNPSLDTSSSSSSDSNSTSDSDSTSSTTSSSSSGSSSDSSSVSDSSNSSRSGRRRVKRRASSSSSARSSIPPRRHRRRSRSISHRPVGSQTSPSSRPRDSPHRSGERARSQQSVHSDPSFRPRKTLSPSSLSPRRVPSRYNSRVEISDYPKDRYHTTYPTKSTTSLRHHYTRSRSISRDSIRSRTPSSPRRDYPSRHSHREGSSRYPGRSQAPSIQKRVDSRSPRGRADRSHSGRDSRGPSRDRLRDIKFVEDSARSHRFHHRPRSVSREASQPRTPPSPRRRYSLHYSDRHARSPNPRRESRASLSPRRGSRAPVRSPRDVTRPVSGYGSRGSLKDRHRRIDPVDAPPLPRRHRHRSRSVSQDSIRSRTPPSPGREHSTRHSHKRERSPRHANASRPLLSKRMTPDLTSASMRRSSRSPSRKSTRPNYEYDSRGSMRVRY